MTIPTGGIIDLPYDVIITQYQAYQPRMHYTLHHANRVHTSHSFVDTIKVLNSPKLGVSAVALNYTRARDI